MEYLGVTVEEKINIFGKFTKKSCQNRLHIRNNNRKHYCEETGLCMDKPSSISASLFPLFYRCKKSIKY